MTPHTLSHRKISKFISESALDLVEHIRKCSASGEELNARDMSDKFLTASSANFALGINTNVFDENCQQGALYYKMTRKLMGRDTTAWENVKMMVAFFLPTLNKVLQFPTFNLRVVDFFFNVIRQTRCLIAFSYIPFSQPIFVLHFVSGQRERGRAQREATCWICWQRL